MTTPTITAVFSFDTDQWQLMATSYIRTEPCGPRLFRGGDLPNIQFSHVDQTEAERDRDILQRYCDLAYAGKAPQAKGREEAEQPKMTVWDLKNAVWCV